MTRAERRIYAFEGFHVDAQRRVLYRADGDPIPLAPKVFDTLLYFVEHQGELLDKHALLEAIWPHVIVEENNLNQSISALRRVLRERPGEHRFIVTEPGRGYRFVATVAQSKASEEFEPALAATGADDEPATPRRGIEWRRIAIAAVSSAIVGTAVWFAARPAPVPPSRVTRFTIPASLSSVGTTGTLAISPDGARFAYVSGLGLFVRPLEALDVTPVPGVAGPRAGAPFFSPDGKWIGFTDGQTLKRVPITGGPAVPIAEVGPAAMANWTAEGILFADMQGLFRVSAEGGTPEALPIDLAPNEQALFPQLLPDRGAVIFTIIPNRSSVPLGTTRTPGARVEVLDLATGEQRTLLHGGGAAHDVPTGHLIYAAGKTLRAVAFDVDRLEVRGESVAVVTQECDGCVFDEFAVSDEGTLVYASGTNHTRKHVLVWVDRQGQPEPLETPVRKYAYPRLSPDGMRIAINVMGPPDTDIWMWDVGRQKLDLFTVDPTGNLCLAWSPDGRLAFGSERFGISNLFWQASDGSGAPERLLVSDRAQMPLSFAPDGRLLFSADVAGRGRDVYALSMDGSDRVEPILDSEANELGAEVSSDGRWIAYDSDESGQPEIYVRPYPDASVSRGWLISSGGGRQPLWARDGSELFYRDYGGAMWAVPVTPGPAFTPGRAVKLFENDHYIDTGPGPFGGSRTFDLSHDGSRFLMIKEQGTTGDAAVPSLVVEVNWFEELKRLVPVPD